MIFVRRPAWGVISKPLRHILLWSASAIPSILADKTEEQILVKNIAQFTALKLHLKPIWLNW